MSEHTHPLLAGLPAPSIPPASCANSLDTRSWSFTLAAPSLPSAVQVRLLAQEANFYRIADEALYTRRLHGHGIDEAAALDVYRFIQIALGRRLPALKGVVQLPERFHRFDAEGAIVETGRLSDQPLFVEATRLAGSAFSPYAAKVIGYSSPEVRATLVQIALGVKPRHVRPQSCMLFTTPPTPALLRWATQAVDALDGACTGSVHRLWWKQWRARLLKMVLPSYLRLRPNHGSTPNSGRSRLDTLDSILPHAVALRNFM